MIICLLCNKYSSGRKITLRTGKIVCGECLLNGESLILKNEDLIKVLDARKPPRNIWDILKYLVICISIIIALILYVLLTQFIGTSPAQVVAGLFFISSLILVGYLNNLSESHNEPFKKDIKQQTDNLKKEQTLKRDELHNIYMNFWDLPPDWEWRRQQVIERARGVCTSCGRRRNGSVVPFHVHHKILKSDKDGNHSIDNLILLCEICHAKVPGAEHTLVKGYRNRRLKKGYGYKHKTRLRSYSQTDAGRYENLLEYLNLGERGTVQPRLNPKCRQRMAGSRTCVVK